MQAFGLYAKFYYAPAHEVGNGTPGVKESDFKSVVLRKGKGIIDLNSLPSPIPEREKMTGIFVVFNSQNEALIWTHVFSFYRMIFPESVKDDTYLGTMYAARNKLGEVVDQMYSGIFGLMKHQAEAIFKDKTHKLVAVKDDDFPQPVQVEPWTYSADGIPRTVEITVEDTYQDVETHTWRIHMLPASLVHEPRFRIPLPIQEYLNNEDLIIEAKGHEPRYDYQAIIPLNNPTRIELEDGSHKQIRIYHSLLMPVDKTNPLNGPGIEVHLTIASNEKAAVSAEVFLKNSLMDSQNGSLIPANDDFYLKKFTLKAPNASIFAHNYHFEDEMDPTRRIGKPYKVGTTGHLDLIREYSGVHLIMQNMFKWDQLYLAPGVSVSRNRRAEKMSESLPILVWVNDEDPKETNSPYALPGMDNTIGIPNLMDTFTVSEREELASDMWSYLRSWLGGMIPVHQNYFKWVCCGKGGGETGGPGIESMLRQDVIMRNSLGISADAFVRGMESLLTLFDANESRQGVDIAFDKTSGEINDLDNMARHFGDGRRYWDRQLNLYNGRVNDRAYPRREHLFRDDPNSSKKSWYRLYESSALGQVSYFSSLAKNAMDHDDQHYFRYTSIAVPSVGYGSRLSKRMVETVAKLKEVQSYAADLSWYPNSVYYRHGEDSARNSPLRGFGPGREKEDWKLYALAWSFEPVLNRQRKEEVFTFIPGMFHFSQLTGGRPMGWTGPAGYTDPRHYPDCDPTREKCPDRPTVKELQDYLAAKHNVTRDRIPISDGKYNVTVVWQNYLAMQLLLNLRQTLADSPDPQIQAKLTTIDNVISRFANLGHIPGRTLGSDGTPVWLTLEEYSVCDPTGNNCTRYLADTKVMTDMARWGHYPNYTNQVIDPLIMYYPHLSTPLRRLSDDLLADPRNALKGDTAPGYWAQQRLKDLGR